MIPELTETEYETLKAAIREAGRVVVPVVVTSDGEVIDGKGRVRAAEELGIKDYPREVVHGLDAEGRCLLRLSLNCARRHLSWEQKQEVVRATLVAMPHLSNSYLGEMAGVSDKTVAAAREAMEQLRSIPKLTALRGKDGKTRPRYVAARNAREQVAAATALQTLGEAAPDRLLTAREVVRKAKRVAVARSRADAQVAVDVPADALVQVHHCDFRDMPLAPGSARLVFTDPLYHREHLDLYSALGEWAARVLQPGGVLVTYLGTSYLPEVVARLGEHLHYVWTVSTVFAGQKTTIHDRHIRTGWKPLLVYSNCPCPPIDWMTDVITAPQAKARHRYQQPEVEADFFIRRLTGEGDLVLDPFCGSGTTAAVSKRLNRRCVTTDIDSAAVTTARERVAKTLVGDPLVRPSRRTAPMPAEDDDFEFASASPLCLPA